MKNIKKIQKIEVYGLALTKNIIFFEEVKVELNYLDHLPIKT